PVYCGTRSVRWRTLSGRVQLSTPSGVRRSVTPPGAGGGPGTFDAFEAFVREYQDMVFATAVRLLGRESDAEDVAQTVFLRAFERFAELEGSPAVAGWLKTVATNLCLNHLKRHRSRWTLFSEIEPEYTGPSLEDRIARLMAGPDERDAVEEIERAERLERALRELP